MAVDVANFDVEVLEKSRDLPVLVDFWAPWCGPCRVLGPVLDKIASEQDGRWVLAKVNTDEYPEISMQYGIRGIPAVKLFVNGEVTAEFTGAMPEYAVRKWMEENLPSAEQDSVAYAASLVGEGRLREAQSLLEELDGDEARVLLARLIVFTDPIRATDLVASIGSSDAGSRSAVEAVREVAKAVQADVESFPEGSGQAPFAEAVTNTRSGRLDEALAAIVQSLQVDRFYFDDAPRKLGVALFTLLGPDDPVTRKHRRLFDMYLY